MPVMTRNLILNVDDIGIHEGAVGAAVETITNGPAASGSVMTICPGTVAALELLADHPEVPVGVHLTLVRDNPEWMWAPLTAGASIQHDGLLFPNSQRDQLLSQAVTSEIKSEFRAQIEVALEAGLQLTHLDWHCLADGGREDIFDLSLALADDYQLAVRAWSDYGRKQLQTRGRVATDQPFLDSFAIPVTHKENYLLDRIRDLPVGLSEWALHPAAPKADDDGSDVRVSDHRALMSPTLRETIDDQGITVLGYGDPPLQAAR